MHLGKKKLQELKEKKISIEDLNDRYFVNSYDSVEARNVLRLLNENVYDFREIVNKSKSIEDYNNEPCLLNRARKITA